MASETYSEHEAHEHFAKSINAEVWTLLGSEHRTPEDVERMVHAAHASCYHWLQVGTPVQHQRAEWLTARVYAELGMGDEALRHARRCLKLTEEYAEGMQDFDLAYAQEGMARAHAARGDWTQALNYREAAIEVGALIVDDEDRSIFESDFEGGDWHGLA